MKGIRFWPSFFLLSLFLSGSFLPVLGCRVWIFSCVFISFVVLLQRFKICARVFNMIQYTPPNHRLSSKQKQLCDDVFVCAPHDVQKTKKKTKQYNMHEISFRSPRSFHRSRQVHRCRLRLRLRLRRRRRRRRRFGTLQQSHLRRKPTTVGGGGGGLRRRRGPRRMSPERFEKFSHGSHALPRVLEVLHVVPHPLSRVVDPFSHSFRRMN